MIEAPLPTASYYREKARELRRFAWRARATDVRLELFDLAERFDRMAGHVDRRERTAETGGSDLERATYRKPAPLHPMPIEMGGRP